MNTKHLRLVAFLVLVGLLLSASLHVQAANTPSDPQPRSVSAASSNFTVSTTASGSFTYVGTTHTATICDADLNSNPPNLVGDDIANMTVFLYPIAQTISGDPALLPAPLAQQPLVLNETSAGCFTGTFTNTALAGIVPNQKVAFYYDDASQPAATRYRYFTLLTVGTNDTLSVTPASGSPGTTLTITVTDLDRNLNAGAGNDGPRFVAIRNMTDSPGFFINLPLAETGTGVFSGTITSNSSLLDDTGGVIPGSGDTIQVEYQPDYIVNAVATPANLITRTHLVTGTNGTIAVNISSPSVAAGNTLLGAGHTVTVTDADRNITAGPGNDAVTVRVIQPNSPVTLLDEVCTTLNLVETSTPGVFTNAVPYVIADLANCDWTQTATDFRVNGEPGSKVRFSYSDVSAAGTTVDRTVDFTITSVLATMTVAPAEAVPGTAITITVSDVDQNITAGAGNNNPPFPSGAPLLLSVGIRRTVGVPYTTAVANRVEIQLTETGQGVFTGTLPSNSIVDGAATAAIVGDTLEFFYTEPLATTGATRTDAAANVVTATHVIRGTDGSVTVSPDPISPFGALTVTVTDSDLNTNSTTAQTANADIFHILPGGGAPVADGTIVLTETGNNTGIFRGTFSVGTAVGAPLPVNTKLFARYSDVGTASGPATVIRESNQVTVRELLAEVTVVPEFVIVNTPDNIILRVSDPDENATAGPGNDNVSITLTRLTNCTGACTQAFAAVPESATTEGIFDQILTYAGLDAIVWGAPDNPIAVGDQFRVDYNDVTNYTGAPVVVNKQFQIIGGQVAVLTVTPTIISPNGILTIKVVDLDRNLNPGPNNDTIQVNMRNQTKNTPLQNFIATETSTPGVFTADVNIANPAWGFNVAIGDTLRVTYIDPFTSGGGTNTLTADAIVAYTGAVATLQCTNTIPGRPIEVTLSDQDLDSLSSVKIPVLNVNTGEIEDVELLKIGTGLFRAQLNTAYGLGSDGVKNGVLIVKAGDVVRCSYKDEYNNTPNPITVTVDVSVTDRRTAVKFCDGGATRTDAPTWRGEYYNNKSLEGTPSVVVDEVHLSMNWEETSPFPQIGIDNWSARWTTTIDVTRNGKFRFRLGADDGVRLWIDDKLELDQFNDGSFRTWFVDVSLAPGLHRIRVEYYESAGQAGILVDCQFVEAAVAAIDAEGNTVDIIPSDVNVTEATAHITTGRINVRANPVVTAARIAYVYIYERYPILGVTEDGDWFLIQLKDGRTGWVAAQFVKRYEEIPVQIFPNFSGSEAALPNVEVAAYAKVELNVRDVPRGDNVVTIMPAGTAFRVLSRTQSGAWLKVEIDGIQGWILNLPEYVGFTNGTINDLPRE